MGGLFYACCDEMADLRFAQALALLLERLAAWLNDMTNASNHQIQRMLWTGEPAICIRRIVAVPIY
ncbi:MAG: hypothetical protein U1D96_03815 [Eubacteriales bacterium]|nr:hypothetical protein [Desulforudis sp.]MDP3051727.1 hypothetical protein [Eubacteriales bacterium]MDZ4042603.1 hypothetical protein [Eubacteriales bacterium]